MHRGNGTLPGLQCLCLGQVCIASKAVAGRYSQASPTVILGTADSGRYRGQVAVALQNVREPVGRVRRAL